MPRNSESHLEEQRWTVRDNDSSNCSGPKTITNVYACVGRRPTAGPPIYVHSKVLVVDERLTRVGSSNLNNRSMDSTPSEFWLVGKQLECEHLVPVDEFERVKDRRGCRRPSASARRSGWRCWR
jgi:hypothetical protein